MRQPWPRYFCTVRTPDNKVNTLLGMFERDLADRYDQGERRAIARTVFREQLGWDAAQLESHRGSTLSESELLQVYEPLKQLRAGVPLQYALGRCWFHGLRLEVGPGVLIPRPETEELVDRIIASGRAFTRIVDIGTGSGCIALALWQAFPQAQITGIDISEEALRMARRNGTSLGATVEWRQADVLADDFHLPEGTDLLVSNPPYVPQADAADMAPHVREHEPHIALFVADNDPLCHYRRLAELALRDMQPGAQLWTEGHHLTAREAGALFRSMGLVNVEVLQDLSGNDRYIRAER